MATWHKMYITNFNENWVGWIVDAVDKVACFEEKDLLSIEWGKIIQERPLVEKVICYEKELVGIISEMNLMGS